MKSEQPISLLKEQVEALRNLCFNSCVEIELEKFFGEK